MEATKQRKLPRTLKADRVFAGISLFLLFTPIWLLYGYIGHILSCSSKRLTGHGLFFLATLSLLLSLCVALQFQIQVALYMGSFLAMLLWIQSFALESIIKTIHGRNLLQSLLLITLVFLVGLTCQDMYHIPYWTSTKFNAALTYTFAVIYLLLPVATLLSHHQVWIPARYSELERIEEKVIASQIKSEFHLLKVAGLGTVYVPCTAKKISTPPKSIVLLHGYASGNALWAANLAHLAQYYDVYALEWVGKGRSDRPAFPTYCQETLDEVFIDAIETWRKEVKLEKFYLAAHSMGAMFATSYILKYPNIVEHLVLISPAGVGYPPASFSFRQRPLFVRLLMFLWSLRLTPMSLIRFAGPFGPALTRKIIYTRMEMMPPSSILRTGIVDAADMAEYWYHNWALKRSGEIAMHTHLLPGIYAKKPLCEMLIPEKINNMPITFMYGGGPDWMDSKHAEKVVEAFEKNDPKHHHVKILKVPLAGHQVFMDNHEEFNTMITTVLQETHQKKEEEEEEVTTATAF